MPDIRIQCPAKINLTLKVTGKRPDGFHDIESIMQTISLYDYLNISIKPSEVFKINLSGNSKEIPYDENNLVHKAISLFFYNINSFIDYEINVYIEKNIPIAAGLAGGSTDAAGVLYGLNKLLTEPLTKEQLHGLCAELGSDLNVCLEGGTLLAKGRGEIFEPIEYKEQNVSLIKPNNLGISAKEAYTKFSKKLELGDTGRNDYVNDLEWAIIDDYPELQKIKNLYPKSVMSGSGSTYYMLGDVFEKLDDCKVYNNLKTTNHGVEIILK